MACDEGYVERNEGLHGDRYFLQQGFWHPVEACPLTLIGEKDLLRTEKRLGRSLNPGEHRRNLVIQGIKAENLKNKNFQIGEAIFSYHKPRPPCGYLNQITNSNLSKALGLHSGICVHIKQSGKITVGDELIILN